MQITGDLNDEYLIMSMISRYEKEIDVISYTGKGKYDALYLQTNVLQKLRQSILSMP